MRFGFMGAAVPWKRLFAEFAVIVAGVLIALAVNSWWERRQERNHGEEYLRQLLVDVVETEGRLRGTIDTETQRLVGVNAVLARAQSGSWPPADSLELPTGYNYFEPLTGTLTALVQGGDLRLVRSDSLRFDLIAYSALMHETQTILRHTETLIWNSTERVVRGRVRHSQPAGRRGWGPVDVAGVMTDPEIISALQLQVAATQIRLFNLGRLEEPTSRILGLIRTALH